MDKRTTFAVDLAMQTATPYIAIVVSVVSLVISLGVAIANYSKSKSDAFIQRRDHLSQTIAELNVRNAEAQGISARYEIVAVKTAGLPLRRELAEQNLALIASIKKVREAIEEGRIGGEQTIKKLHLIYSGLTLESDAAQVEGSIALAHVNSDELKQLNEVYYSSLYILETNNQDLATKQAEIVEKLRQINLAFERGMKNLGL